MSKIHRRLLLITVIGACLLGLAGTGALAGVSMGSTPNVATQNSIWNIHATWQDDDGCAPVLDKTTTTEGFMDFGFVPPEVDPNIDARYTIGRLRNWVPGNKDGTAEWTPWMPMPDGFVGFPTPFALNGDPLAQAWEFYQDTGYASIQPDPANTLTEAGLDPAYDHGVDIMFEQIVKSPFFLEVPDPAADFSIAPMACPAADPIPLDDTHTDAKIFPRPATPALIVTSRVPVLLIGVWDDKGNAVKACLTNAATLNTADPDPKATREGWPSYNVIQVLEDPKVVARINSYVVAYYAPGTAYAMTQYPQLPMPYTVYKIPLAIGSDGVPYLPINDGILKLNPNLAPNATPMRDAVTGAIKLDANGKIRYVINETSNRDESPVIGIYPTQNLETAVVNDPNPNPSNYFDVTAATTQYATPHVRYEGPEQQDANHPTFGKLYFNYDPLNVTPPVVTTGTAYYVVVSTDAVDGVYTDPAGGDASDLYSDPTLLANYSMGRSLHKKGYCAKSGIIALAKPAAAPVAEVVHILRDGTKKWTYVRGQSLFIKYRPLSNNTVTVGRTNSVGLVDHCTGTVPAVSPAFTLASTDAQPNVSPGKFIVDAKTLPIGTFAVGVNYWPVFPMVTPNGSLDPMGVVWYKGAIPMRARKGDIVNGETYWVSVSDGLKMSNAAQQPDNDVTLNVRTANNKLIYDEFGWPMYYDGALIGADPNTPTWYLTCIGYGVKNRNLITYQVRRSDNVGVVVHSGATRLDVYSDSASMPQNPGVDPLAVEPVSEANPSFPDDGSGSTQFVFRCVYYKDGSIGVMPPLPWMRWQADPWANHFSSGVVLYLDEKGTGDYKPHFMQPDYESNGMGGNTWYYRVIPHNSLSLLNTNNVYSWPFQDTFQDVDNDLYQSLQMGVYHYFFGTSSDSLQFTDYNGNLNTFAFENQNPNPMDPNDSTSKTGLEEWGQIPVPSTYTNGPDYFNPAYPYYSTGLDPSVARAVTGYPAVDRPKGRRYSPNGRTPDTSLYVTRSDRAPGLFEGTYKYPYVADVHPRVSCELHMPSMDDKYKRYDDVDYGQGRFFGTLFPFRSAMNPMLPGVRIGGTAHSLAETSGSYSTDTNVFQIMYKQIDNKAPIEIKLWVNNASEKSPADAAHAYTSYTMQRKTSEANPDYRAGVWYQYILQSGTAQLPYGPHTYYFTAYDGEHHVRWPVRPDQYTYNWPGPSPAAGVMNIVDTWVPTASYAYESRTAGYFDNDYVPGPYVNHAPKITNVAVTPSSGKEGTHFVYSFTYSDEDGQRPYTADITIQMNDGGELRTFAMQPDPSLNIDPTADNSALYKAGVKYILDTATVADLALGKGTRKFYIQVRDDWARQDEPNDRRPGELVQDPPGAGNWTQGPTISGNRAPTLTNPRISSMDNTSNSATVWSFKVTYMDQDQDAPSVIKLFIGRLQPQDLTTPTPSGKTKTIIWDAGHAMLPTGSDTVYAHGVDYEYRTRLAGPDTVAPQMVTKQLTIASAASAIDPDPSKSGDIVRVWKVYTSGDPNHNYYGFGGDTPPDYTGGTIALASAIPAGQIWITYERRPVVQYYYAFEAYDGVDYATYQTSSKAETRSDAANCFIMQDAQSQDSPTNKHYKIRPKVAKPLTLTATGASIDPDPARIGDIIRIWGVYDNEDLAGTNYYPLAAGKTLPDAYDNTTHPNITLTKALSGKIWLLVEGDTPLVGPMPAQQFAPAGVIPDPQVYINYSQNSTPQPITDQKNGFIDELTGNVDRSVVFMGGQAAYTNRPSKEYVSPNSPDDIASVEGVYWLSNPDLTHQYDNYYDPAKLVPPVVRAGTLGVDGFSASLADPEEVYKVLGVYDNANLTGINYYTGDRTAEKYTGDTNALKWQPASLIYQTGNTATVISPNVIWPSKPNDIGCIAGVFKSMNISDPAGNFWTPDSDLVNASYVVPATVDVNGNLIIDQKYNLDGAIKAILHVNEKADMSGQDYYAAADQTVGDPYDPATPPVVNPVPAIPNVYVSFIPAERFGPTNEWMVLRKEVTPNANSVNLPSTVYIAYYPPGDLNSQGMADLTMTPSFDSLYVKIWAKGFNPGDGYIKLTTLLPDLVTTGAVKNSGLVTPDINKLADIGTVTGVYLTSDLTGFNYYAGTANPFNVGDTDIHLNTALPNPLATSVTVTYLPRQRDVIVKYNDMRFLHTFSGWATKINTYYYSPMFDRVYGYSVSNGTTHFYPDNLPTNVGILGNDPITGGAQPVARDIDSGIVGMWLYPQLTGPNLFNPRRTSLYSDDPWLVRLSTEAPDGTDALYARAYQKGVYFIDRWNRDVRFDLPVTMTPLTDLDRVQVSYFFGTRMTQVVVPNTLPVLSSGRVSPINGSRNAQYVYTVTYKDIDGPTGQMPTYVRVFIDGIPHDMAAANQGTPNYKAGAVFTFAPTGGLSGKPHTFYFEASDGAAVAWFDKLGAHNSDKTAAAVDIVGIDGPWVNDAPSLLNGIVSPNPQGQGQGIGTTDSVDYHVTLVDVDNDPPYTFDPLRDLKGQDVSGSPRVWIDAGLNDDTNAPITYTIIGLEPDPSDVSKMRMLKVGRQNASGHFDNPGWTTNQFAGQLLQISNGNTWNDISPSPYTAVYLIQSNTADRLLIASEDLVNDKLYPVPPDPATGVARYAQFRINGLLLSKTDPNQADNWATGVDYKITVPKLTVGAHKFHFTARTREDKPDWLLNSPGFTLTDPYSIMVRFPQLGDSDGPNVISKPPDTNVAPVLTLLPTAPSQSLYRGPGAQPAKVLTPSSVLPYDFSSQSNLDYGNMLTILGVYRNANFDAHLDPMADLQIDQLTNFFDAGNTSSNPPATGVETKLAPNLYACPDTMVLVQRSSSVVDATTVVPEAAGSIGAVLGVYLTSDPTLQNIFGVASPSLGAGNRITLTKALPVGTTSVYITYNPAVSSMTLTADGTGKLTLASTNNIAYVKGVYLATDAAKTTNLITPAEWQPGNTTVNYTGGTPVNGASVTVDYVAWPPVYIKYYGVEPTRPPTETPKVHGPFKAGEPLTFAIFYKDANGDKPTYHDGVQGYVNVVLNDLPNTSASLSALAPPVDYRVGVPYGVTLTDLPPGKHTYHFSASDGYVVARYPIDQTGSATLDEKVQINFKPVLSKGGVDHSSGATTFQFSVTYQDSDNVAPAAGGFVKAIITSQATPSTVIAPVVMTAVAGSNYFTGAVFNGTLDVAARHLAVGAYNVVFVANDGIQDADPLGGTTITVRAPDPNHHPIITDYAVYKLKSDGTFGPATGKTTDTFVYRARYKDSYNDAPVATFGGVQKAALTLIIDGDTTHPYPMLMATMTGTPDYTGADTAHWPWWEARVAGTVLKGGNHNYTVTASDGTVVGQFDTGVPSIKYGPTLMIPYFVMQAVGKDGSVISGGAIVGQEALIRGQMYFPYTTPDQKPVNSSDIVIQVTKPDATIVSLNGSLTVRDYDPINAPANWIGDIAVHYSGYVDPALATGTSLTLVASGQWIVDAIWAGDATYDGARTDSVLDGRNDQVRVSVSGPSRTVATSAPLSPETAAPVVDMITPPMMIGSTDPGKIFGSDRALTMQIVKWQPSTGQYFRYDLGGYFPPLMPGDAVWIKPKLATNGLAGSGYPAAESITRAAVEGGWTALDNPAVQLADVGGTPRYLTDSYRLIKVLAQSYTLKTDSSGNVVLDSATALPQFKPCTLAMSSGWNQFGCIFFNWKKDWQSGTAVTTREVVPADPTHISRVLGVYRTASPTADDINYFQPGVATQPYARGDASIHLTSALPAGVTAVYVKYEAYPKQDLGIPISEVHVSHLGVRKTLAEAKTAGWITDYAWRYDANAHNYVAVSETRAGAERVLKSWSGYWIRAFVDCDFEIDPNTTYNGVSSTAMAIEGPVAATAASSAGDEMLPPPPAPKD